MLDLRFSSRWLKNAILWVIAPCSSVKGHRHRGGTCRLHLPGRRVSQARHQQEASGSAACLSYLLFDSENGDSTLLRNLCGLLPKYMALQPRRSYSSRLQIFAVQNKIWTKHKQKWEVHFGRLSSGRLPKHFLTQRPWREMSAGRRRDVLKFGKRVFYLLMILGDDKKNAKAGYTLANCCM
jgi:hypothetical protein